MYIVRKGEVGLQVPLDSIYIQRESSMDTDVKTLSIIFLICCYFGQSENLGKAAIDIAYVDMAAHTLKEPDESDRRKKV